MAWVDDAGRSAMIPNAEGELITPSVVFFSESEVVVGKNARTAITSHPEMVAQWVKRDMGAPYYSHPIRGHYLPPEVIQACILRKLKTDLVSALGPDMQAVITVPAYFDEMRRKATADAGEMAGLRVLDIVNEPTAAALAFGEALGYLVRRTGVSRREQELTVLVYDLGGGTFDVTLLRLAAGKVADPGHRRRRATWRPRLGPATGRLCGRVLPEDAIRSIPARTPPRSTACTSTPWRPSTRFPRGARRSSRSTTRAASPRSPSPASSSRRCRPICWNAPPTPRGNCWAWPAWNGKTCSGSCWSAARRACRWSPACCRTSPAFSPNAPSIPTKRSPAGPRSMPAICWPRGRGGPRSTFQVTNVNAHSLGVEGIDTETLRKKNVVLIPRNTPLPARHTERFATKSEGQRSIVIKVLEGESTQPGDCIAIGRTVVRDLPSGLPKGWPVEVTFEYGANGRLAVDALVPGTQHRARLELVRETGLSSEGLARWKQPVAEAGGFSTFESAIQDVLRSTLHRKRPRPVGSDPPVRWPPLPRCRRPRRLRPRPPKTVGRRSTAVDGVYSASRR